MSKIKSLFRYLSSLFFPPKCNICGKFVKNGDCLCDTCLDIWEREKTKSCRKCGKPHIECNCPIKFSENHLKSVLHLAEYEKDSVSKVLILKIKDNPSEDTVNFLSRELAKRVRDRDDFKSAVVTFVPRRKEMIIKTGCDQAKDLASGLCGETGKELHTLLTRRGNKAEKNMNAEERHANVRGAYNLISNAGEIIKDKTVYIVDDIITTGTTVNYCAYLLLCGGAKEVVALSVARRT